MMEQMLTSGSPGPAISPIMVHGHVDAAFPTAWFAGSPTAPGSKVEPIEQARLWMRSWMLAMWFMSLSLVQFE